MSPGTACATAVVVIKRTLTILRRATPMMLAPTGFSLLKTFDALMPKDPGSKRVAEGIAYGENPRHRLDVYAPSSVCSGSERRPILVFFYGGSWNSGTRTGYTFVGRAFSAQGFVTLIPDYRLVPQVRYPCFIEDGAAVVRWAKAHAAQYGGDADRIVIAGHSAGAYIAAMLAVDRRWLEAERQAIRGFIGIAGPYDFAPFDVSASQEAFGAWPHPAETQPVTWAGSDNPPTLLLVGEEDRTVRPRNSDVLAARLKSAGAPVRIVRYPGVDHVGTLTSIARPFRRRASIFAEAVDFARTSTA